MLNRVLKVVNECLQWGSEPRVYSAFRTSVFSVVCLLFCPENSPLKSSLSSSLSTCRRTSRSPFPRRLLMKAWNPETFAALMLIRADLEASAFATKGCCEVDNVSCS